MKSSDPEVVEWILDCEEHYWRGVEMYWRIPWYRIVSKWKIRRQLRQFRAILVTEGML
jgi:hypothetical protein